MGQEANSFEVKRIDERYKEMHEGVIKITNNGLEFHRVSYFNDGLQ
jgi:hypothetical protein